MPDILHTPNREQVVTTNAWAFLHWLRIMRGVRSAGLGGNAAMVGK